MDYSQIESWDKVRFQSSLLAWFEREGREFPWRDTEDPYAVLVAEKLLQQTQAREGVVSAYKTILTNYPTPEALAFAELLDLEEVIQPLGLKYRATELITMAAELVSRHGGRVPDDFKGLLALTGVGSYSARAVLSFVYGADVPVVDTNVARILYRLFGIAGDMPANPARKRSLIELADFLLPPSRSRDFNLAMLDLGALICSSRSPKCPRCPVSNSCIFGKRQTHLPSGNGVI